MRFVAVDTLTGRIVSPNLTPVAWDLKDPLRGPGTGTLSLSLPADPSPLREALAPRRRWIAVADEQGAWLWGGPVVRRPSYDSTSGLLSVPLADWRTWFHRAPIRPLAGAWRDYIVTGREQGLIAEDLMHLALDGEPQAPPVIVETAPATGVPRDLTARMLDRSVGDWLDSLVAVERGIEWWTTPVTSLTDPGVIEIHARAAYPERTHRGSPLLLEWQRGVGGNCSSASWPQGSDAPTRVWAVGDGEPPARARAQAQTSGLDEGVDVLWEETLGPLDGVRRNKTAYSHAAETLDRGQGRDALAEFEITTERLPLNDVAVGDRCRVRYSDGGWTDHDGPGRIVERHLLGGRGQATRQRLVVDLEDTLPPDGDDIGTTGEG